MPKKRCPCCCPSSTESDSIITEKGVSPGVTLTSLLGPSPFSPFGVTPDFVQRVSPSFYHANEQHEEDEVGGSVCVPTGYPPDPSYPSDSRSDCNALTPIYRGGQNSWFTVIDSWASHGALDSGNNASVPPVWDAYAGTPFPAYSSTSLSIADKQQYRKDWFKFIFPQSTGFVMRGLKQLYDSLQPFADPTEPTVSEFELWNHSVLNHFRAMSALPPAIS